MDLDFDLLIWLIGFVFLTILLVMFWRKHRSTSYLFCIVVFWVYIMLAIRETIFPIPLSGEMVDMMRKEVPFMSRVNLIPFHFGQYASIYAKGVIINCILNVILTIPFGFGISFISRIKPQKIIKLALTVGFSIESIQLVISLTLGFPYRTIDINDIILNAIGVIVGYGFFSVFSRLFIMQTERLNIKHKGLAEYIYIITSKNHDATFTP